MKEFKKVPTHIVIHTAAFRGKANAKIIDKWHIDRGFHEIGYHYVITGSMFDDKAELQYGRHLKYQGAHSRFFNKRSIGICVTGHGDHIEFEQRQLDILGPLVLDLMKASGIPIKNVIGHRDTPYEKIFRKKSCPGNLIDMDEVRKFITSYT